MACDTYNINNPNVTNEIAALVLQGVKDAIAAAGLKAFPRAYIGIGPIPSQDCCPDLVVWISNIRLNDSNVPDTLRENRLLGLFGVAFNVNVRVGECFFEITGTESKPELVASNKITKMASLINQYGYAAFMGAIRTLLDLDECGLSVTPYNSDPYQMGLCAGFQFSFAVSLV